MGIKRIVDTAFWTDGKVDEFTPEDKYFMLYLLTNPFSTQLGIYEISIKQVAFQLGYSMDAVKNLIDRFENKYGIVVYSPNTNEIAIKNFLRHSIIKGGKPVEDCIKKELQKVKNKKLIFQVFKHIAGKDDLNCTVKKIISEYKNETDNDNDNDNDNENEVSYHDSYHDSSTTNPPTLSQVIEYAQNNQYVHVNPTRFFTYYNGKGWETSNGNPIDWKAKIQEWDFADKQKAEATAKNESKPSNNPFLELAKEENLF